MRCAINKKQFQNKNYFYFKFKYVRGAARRGATRLKRPSHIQNDVKINFSNLLSWMYENE